ncbi:MAG TPA: hypothetical protein VEZ55_11200 [Chitinophagaceae bacterium]|nr:hypothetical protein [Chitinophagaceae bacterium]
MLLTTKEPRLVPPRFVRQAIGWIAILLPAMLIAGNYLLRGCSMLQGSISHYYYTITGHWLVGILSAVAMFLISYKGYNKLDSVVSSVAGFAAIFIAVFPTNRETLVPEVINIDACILFSLPENALRSVIHYASAAVFFLALAYISLFLFTKSRGGKTREKILRNKVFRTCGVVIVIAIALIAVYGIFENEFVGLKAYHPVFWLEWLALLAFGISWLVKGEFALRDHTVYGH